MKRWTKRAPLFILFAIAGALAMGALVMVLWNAIIPAVFHAGTITLLQGAGLIVLTRLLFGGFRRGTHGGRHCKHQSGGRDGQWQGSGNESFSGESAGRNEYNVHQYVASWQMRYNPESAL